jgi:hypothetical protein
MTDASPRWVRRWGDEIDPRAAAPGVFKRKAGGFRVRARVRDPRTGRQREVCRVVEVGRVRDASAALARLVTELRAELAAGDTRAAVPRFADYAAAIFERKIAEGRIASAAGRAKWQAILTAHLLPAFGPIYLDRLQAADVERWKASFGAKVQAGKAAPTSGNTILSILRVITAAAADELDIPDPMRRVRPFDTRAHRTYTREAPNSLAPADLPRFLEAMRRMFPAYFAITVLGFVTGLRPSTLRPLRRRGPSADVDWNAGVLYVRRSHTLGREVMEATKTGRDQRINLPPRLLEILRAHVEGLTGRAAASDLLFPSPRAGGFLHPLALAAPFAAVGAAIGLPYKLTPRAMRRTFQDLAREAGVSDVVTRAISGHATEAMQRHYSTARDHEIGAALEAIWSAAAPASEAN